MEHIRLCGNMSSFMDYFDSNIEKVHRKKKGAGRLSISPSKLQIVFTNALGLFFPISQSPGN